MLEPPVPIRDPRRRQRVVLIVALILLVSAALRLYQVAAPAEYMFDEVYYAKDAKAIVDGRVGPKPPLLWAAGDNSSWPHPEMGKFAIAAGVLLFGDRAFGWRVPAVVAGLVILACVYPLARRLGLPPTWALIALVFAAADPLGIAQSRIATLDVFVAAWSVLCIYLALRYVQEGRRRRWLLLSALAGGMAVSTKWSGALALIVVAVVLVIAWLRDRGSTASAASAAAPADGAADEPAGPAVTGVLAAAPTARQSLVQALPAALLAASILVLIPAAVYLLGYAQYFAAGHTWGQLMELLRQAYHYNLNLKAEHRYASPSYTWIFDYRPVWYYYQGGDTIRGVIAIGNPFLWWLAVAGAIVAVVLAALRRSYFLLPTVIIVALLYVPWFGASRTSFLFYMTPVAPFLAILAAGLLLVVAGRAQLPRYGAWVMTGAAVATAALWDTIAAASQRAAGVTPALRSFGAGWAAVSVGVVAAAAVLTILLMADIPPVRAARPYIALALAGVVVGIVFAFIPIVLNIPISPGHFSHITWFRSWI